MSSPATVEWSDVIDNFMTAVKEVLYEVGSFIATHAKTIAEAMLGIGLAYMIYRYSNRLMPILGRIFGGLF